MILQDALPEDMCGPTGLPGVRPWTGLWLHVDDAFVGQMDERERLIADEPEKVIYCAPEAEAVAAELLEVALEVGRDLGYARDGETVFRPDGKRVLLGAPMATLGRLFQNDFVILQKQGSEHVLTAAVLCFPASWMLAEKAGRPLMGIHAPVPSYTPRIGASVQRMFDVVRVGQPLWRFNRLWYDDPTLFQPRSENAPRDQAVSPNFVRCERQTIVRLPKTQAVVFAIHTYVVARDRALLQMNAEEVLS